MRNKIYLLLMAFFVVTISAIAAPPKVTNFSPISGNVGTTVTINGSNFDLIPTSNIVRFGVTSATVLSATTSKLTVSVPAGASYAPITVQNKSTGLSSASSYYFLPTFSPNKGRIHDTDFVVKTGLNIRNGRTISATVSDLNSDGKPDLLALGSSDFSVNNKLYIGTNTTDAGVSSFTKDSVLLGSTASSINMTAGDIDGDGKPDVVVAFIGLGSITICRNTTSTAGGKITFAPNLKVSTVGAFTSMALIDMDGDGKKDLVSCSSASNFISVLPNTSTAGNISFGAQINFIAGKGSLNIACADLDGDGKYDVVCSNRGATSISVFQNTSTGVGNFNFATKLDYTTMKGGIGVSIADIDSDGKLDIVSSSDSVNYISIFRNLCTLGNINFAPMKYFFIGNNMNFIGLGDFDGDGKIDLAVNAKSISYSTYFGAAIVKNISTPGNFTFETPALRGGYTYTTGVGFVGDITLDGKPDIVNYGDDYVLYYENKIALAGNANLDTVYIAGGTLSPNLPDYTKTSDFFVNMPYDSSIVQVFADVVDTGYASLSVQVNGKGYKAITAKTYSPVSLDPDTNYIQIKVTAQNGIDKIYTITAVRVLRPQLLSASTNSGTIGSLVALKGKNLSVNPSVSIGGVNAVIVNYTDSTITVMVMPNTPSGQIKVTTISGSYTFGDFFAVTSTSYPNLLEGRQSIVGNGGYNLGNKVALSADGNTAVYGCIGAASGVGATGVSNRRGSSWSNITLYGGIGNKGTSSQGSSVAVSADGNTFIVGGPGDNNNLGAAWVFVKKDGYYQQQGKKLVGTGYDALSSTVDIGSSVAINADGNTVAIGGPSNSYDDGIVWVFSRKDTIWTQQAIITVPISSAHLGDALAFSADGNTLLIGADGVSNNIGSSFVYVRNGTTWTQQAQLTGTGYIGLTVHQGAAVSLSADGNTALIGGYFDSSARGACWMFKRTGSSWKQDGQKIVNDYIGDHGQFGYSVSLNADGNIAAIGSVHNSFLIGQPSIYKKVNGKMVRVVDRLASTGLVSSSNSYFGSAVAISSDGYSAVVGASGDDSRTGAVWHYTSNISNVSTLSALTTSVGFLTPSFNTTVSNYNLNAGTTSKISVTPTLTDSTATILVSINASSAVSVLNGAASSFLSLNYGTNTITVTVISQAGTSNVYTLSVTRDCPKDTTTTVKNLCTAALPYSWNGSSYTSSGTYYKTFTATTGCDSVVVLNLTVINITPTTATLNLSGCNSLLYKGITYTNSTTFIDTIKTNDGCDSIYNTVNVSIIKFTTSKITKTVSGCNSLVLNGKTFTKSTTYTDTLRSSVNGCDSIYYTYNITVYKTTPITSTININGCGSVTYKSVVYTSSTVLNDTIRTVNGCDSVYNSINITVSPTPSRDTVAIVCNGFSWYGTYYTSDTVVSHKIVNYVSASLKEGFSGTTTATAPAGWTFSAPLSTYQTTGNYGAASPSLKFAASNDQITTPTLSAPATQLSFWLKNQGATGSSLKIEGFNGSSWVTVNTLTTFPSTGTTIQYNATSTPSLPTGLNQFRFTYTKSVGNLALDDISILYSGNAGCDSVIVLHLTTKKATTSTTLKTINSGDSYTFNGTAYTQPGTYVVHLTNSVGCDSAATLILTSTLPVSLNNFVGTEADNNILLKWQTGAEVNTSHFIVQHSNDGNSFADIGSVNAIGSGANGYQFIDYKPRNGSNYYRISCVDKNGKFTFSRIVTVQISIANYQLSIIPNPARDFATINFGKRIDKATIVVYNLTGKVVITHSLNGSSSYKLNTQSLANGVYVIQVNTSTDSFKEKLLINK